MDKNEAKAELQRRLLGLLFLILDLLSSKKFVAALGTSIAAYRESGDVWMAIAPMMTYIVAQGWADWGKEKEKVANGGS
jgi:hypothetical protein